MCQKRKYNSQDDRHALKHIRQLRKRGYENLHVYCCPECSALHGKQIWHVGHKPGSPKMRDFLFGKEEAKR